MIKLARDGGQKLGVNDIISVLCGVDCHDDDLEKFFIADAVYLRLNGKNERKQP